MTHSVDPVIVPIPSVWQEHPEIGPFMEYMMRFWHDLFNKVGAGDDPVNKTIISITGDHTTTGSEFLIVSAAATITLNPNPSESEEVTVKRTFDSGTVTISGAIDGGTFFKMLLKNDSYTFKYSGSEWKII